ncbi:hypothetical protein SLS56_006841 [Neofusicoccum ribis]|uniref:Uncharacterized protein n=1 Tax=Neofusicoccum ribis TaxID=45134 RepID=A0ABR3SPP3_9PEZI
MWQNLFPKRKDYIPASHKEDIEEAHLIDGGTYPTPKPARSWPSLVLSYTWRLLVLLAALWGTFDLSNRLYGSLAKPPSTSCYCGDTVEEAMSLGCKFDELAALWLQPRCIDEELTAEFMKAGPGPDGAWTYYEAIGDDLVELEKSRIPLFAVPGLEMHTSHEWHMQHCLYYWRKMWRTKITGTILEEESDSEHHIQHCSRVIMSDGNFSALDTTLAIGKAPPKELQVEDPEGH